MTKRNVIDFNAAALAAYKKRQAKGKVEVLRSDSPLHATAEADPEMLQVDVDWLEAVVGALPAHRLEYAAEAAKIGAVVHYGELNPANFTGALYTFLRYSEDEGDLAQWLSEDPQ